MCQRKAAPAKPDPVIETTIKVADKETVSNKEQLERKFDADFKKRLMKLQNMRFKDEAGYH